MPDRHRRLLPCTLGGEGYALPSLETVERSRAFVSDLARDSDLELGSEHERPLPPVQKFSCAVCTCFRLHSNLQFQKSCRVNCRL